MVDGYTRGEVAWLLSLTREEAVQQDACQSDSLAHLADEDASDSHTATHEWDPVMTIARWNDVHRARQRAIARLMLDDGLPPATVHEELVIVTLRSWGLTEREVADLVGVDRFAARRQFGGMLARVLDELGGEKIADEQMLARGHDACMKCGVGPRLRSATKARRTVEGRRTTVVIERQTSLCAVCLVTAPRRRERRGTMRELRAA